MDRLRRLRLMNGDEITHRVRAGLRTELDRIRSHMRIGETQESHMLRILLGQRSQFKGYLQASPARRFYLPANDDARRRLRELVERNVPKWKARAVAEADRLCEHRVELLGFGEVQLGEQIDWHRDPVTGNVWPRRFWADYDLVREDPARDPKVIHEINRHQHLPRLGKAFFLTGEERYAEEALQQLSTWIDQNPTGHGVHWHSSLEISLRVLSWLWTIFFILPARCMSESVARRIGGSLFAQVDHVGRYLSEYSSPNTHLLGEAAALYIAGLLFSDLKPAAAWRRAGRAILLQELDRQVTEEGVHGELSSTYHCYSLDFYLQALCIAMHNERRWPPAAWRRVEAMAEFLMHLTRPDGSIPRIGDDDGGRALALQQTHYGCFQDALCTAAVLYGRPEFKRASGAFYEETLWLVGEKAWWLYSFLPDRPPGKLRAAYSSAGYVIQRSSWDAEASYLTFDCGGMGMLRGGHGHADALSITLFAEGKEILVDPGCGVYNGSPEWRDYFRSTRAHNTAVVDGREQSEPGGTFCWKRTAPATLTRSIAHPGLEYVEGEHSGYSLPLQKLIHRRGVLFCRPDCWVIVDRFLGEGSHRCDVLYHFPPQAHVHVDEGRISEPVGVFVDTESARLQLAFASSTQGRAEVIAGRLEPIQGWTSCRYGHGEPAPVVQYSVEERVPTVVLSIIRPLRPDEARPEREAVQLRPGQGTVACSLTRAGCEDIWIVSPAAQAITVQEYEMHGELFWIRRYPSGQHQLFALNASRFIHSGRSMLRSRETMPSVLLQWDSQGCVIEPVNEGMDEPCAAFAES
jgi:hypothetical protein